MRIVCISDTHDQHEKLVVPDGDLLIHAGDFTCHKIPLVGRTAGFANWFKKLPHKYKIVIAGNHDMLFEQQSPLARSFFLDVTYLQDSETIIEGLKIWGSPYTPYWGGWAFSEHGINIKKHWDKIPKSTDILITHGPPFGLLDEVNGEHKGCKYLSEKKKELNLKLHIFGHIHEGYGIDGKNINTAVVNEDYELVNDPVVIDI